MVVAAFSFDKFTGMRVLINLKYAGLALFGGGTGPGGNRAGVKNGNNVPKVLAIELHQVFEFLLELNFSFKSGVIFQCFELGDLLFKCFLSSAKFSESGQSHYSIHWSGLGEPECFNDD